MRADRRRSCVMLTLVLVFAASVVTNRATAGQDDGEEYVRNADKYFYGQGVPQNYVEAARWNRKAAEQGFADAQEVLRRRGLSWTVHRAREGAAAVGSQGAVSPATTGQLGAARRRPADLGGLDD